MRLLRKIWKYLVRTVAFCILVLFLITISIQIPVVQQYLTETLASFLHNKLKTEVQIESIRLRLPESLVLTNFYLEDLQQDTLIHVGELALNFKLNKLLQKRIQFDQIALNNGQVKLRFEADSSNISFIERAFGGETVVVAEDDQSAPWTMTFDDASLALQSVFVNYSDEVSAMALQAKVGEFTGEVHAIDYLANNYQIEDVFLGNTEVDIIKGVGQITEESIDSTTTRIDVNSEALRMRNVDVSVNTPDLKMIAGIGHLKSTDGTFRLSGDDLQFDLPDFSIQDSYFKYDSPAEFAAKRGFDYNHFDINDFTFEVADFSYHNLDFTGNLKQFSGRTSKGFAVENLQSKIDFSSKKIALQEFTLTTSDSDLHSKSTIIEYPFFAEIAADLGQMTIVSQLEGSMANFNDVRFFYPEMDSISFLKKFSKHPLGFDIKADGSLADLNFEASNLQTFQTQAKLKGQFKNVTDPAHLQFNFQVPYLKTSGIAIAKFLPDSILPAYLILPNSIFFSGQFNGTTTDLTGKLVMETKRNTALSPTKIFAGIQLKGMDKVKSMYLNVQIDSSYTTKPDLLAYIPPRTLPDYVNLPDQFMLRGHLKGPVSNLKSNFKLSALRSEILSEINMAGEVSGLFTTDIPHFDLKLELNELPSKELAAFLPSDLIPSQFKIPFLEAISSQFVGTLDSFQSGIQLASNTGYWSAEAMRNKQEYTIDLKVDQLQPAALFTQKYLDSLLGFQFDPLVVELHLSGKGLEWSPQTAADVRLRIKPKTSTAEGLLMEGRLTRQVFTGTVAINEPEVQLESQVHLDMSSTISELEIEAELHQFDIQKLTQSEQPFSLSGKISLVAKGNGLDTLNGRVLMDNWTVHFADKAEEIDSLLLKVALDNGENKIQLESDLASANLEGHFDIAGIAAVLEKHMKEMWQPDEEPILSSTKNHFALDFRLHRPAVLTMGYLPGLEALTPFQLECDFDDRFSAFHLQTMIPFLQYEGIGMNGLSVQLNSGQDTDNYHISLREANIGNTGKVNNFSAAGNVVNGQLRNTFQLLDDDQKERFVLNSTLEILSKEAFQLSFSPNQILNYENWSIADDNMIRWSTSNFEVINWQLKKGQSTIEILTQKGRDEITAKFRTFDLNTIADIIEVDGEYFVGTLNGELKMKGFRNQFSFTTAFGINELVVMNAELGKLKVQANGTKDQIVVDELTLQGNGNDLLLSGDYDLSGVSEALDFELGIEAINLAIIEPFTLGYLKNMAGVINGNLEITGNINQPALVGAIHLNDVAFDIEMLKTRLFLGNQPITFDANLIAFQNLDVLDAKGNKGVISSQIMTSDYRDYHLQSEVDVADFTIMNTQASDNDSYYGHLMVDANAKISGSINSPTIEILATPKRNSHLTYIYESTSNDIVLHDGVVEFTQPTAPLGAIDLQKTRLQEVSEQLNMKLTIRASINKDLDVTIFTDPISRDNFKGKAKGDVVFNMLPNGAMTLNGPLEIIEGNYIFTYQKVIRRSFDVTPGSSMVWTGDPYNPELNINVVYQTLASVKPLLGQANESTNQPKKQTFEVKLNVSGSPSNTAIKTAINYPDEVEGNNNNTTIESAINDINIDASLQNTQAFSLILFNGFMTEDASFDGINTDFNTLDISGNINNVITKQLNNLTNRYIKFVDIDFGFGTTEDAEGTTTRDMQVSISKRFLNDRLLVNLDGKTSTVFGSEQNTSQTYLNNVSVEYSLTPNGQFKIKIYNKREVGSLISNTSVKLGGALVFSKDFDRIRFISQ